LGGQTSLKNRSRKTLRLISGLALSLYGLLLIFSLMLPIYKLIGPISGEISLLHYNLAIFGKPITIDALERARTLSTPILAIAIASSILGISLIASVARPHKGIMLRAAFSLSLAFPSASALAYLSRLVLVNYALGEIPMDLSATTSAGVLVFQQSQLLPGPSALLLSPALATIPPVIALGISAIDLYLEIYAS